MSLRLKGLKQSCLVSANHHLSPTSQVKMKFIAATLIGTIAAVQLEAPGTAISSFSPVELATVEYDASYEAAGILNLTEDNFDEALANHPDGVLVIFCASWHGYCKRDGPTYVKVAQELKNKGSAGVMAYVDADGERGLAQRFDIRGFPTIMWFHEGNLYGEEYNGGAESQDFFDFIATKTS